MRSELPHLESRASQAHTESSVSTLHNSISEEWWILYSNRGQQINRESLSVWFFFLFKDELLWCLEAFIPHLQYRVGTYADMATTPAVSTEMNYFRLPGTTSGLCCFHDTPQSSLTPRQKKHIHKQAKASNHSYFTLNRQTFQRKSFQFASYMKHSKPNRNFKSCFSSLVYHKLLIRKDFFY